MFGLLSDIKAFFDLLFSLGDFLLLGAMIAGLGWLTARLFAGSLSGLLGAMSVGAALAVYAIIGDWLADDGGKVARLEAELRTKAAKLDEIRATSAQLQDFLARGRSAAEHNAGVIADLHRQIETVPDCAGVPEAFTDDLKKLR